MRIGLDDTAQDALIKMVEGNPGALNVCMQTIEKAHTIDPDNILGAVGYILALDALGIYGSKIWMLYKDVCGESVEKMVAMLRACQLGFTSRAELFHAIENRGAGIDVDTLVARVQERLPAFWNPSPVA